MKQYKYLVVFLKSSNEKALEAELNKLGKLGWELVAISPGDGRFHFKKESKKSR
jgi:hypothetical protein